MEDSGQQARQGDQARVLARVLVVEDDPEAARELVAALGEEGYAVTHAERGWQALALLALAEHEKEGPFAVILLDLGLPDLDGLAVCRQARSDGYAGAILIVSARSSELDRVVGLDHGADDYVVKPCSVPEVQARVRALLRRTARAAVATAPGGVPLVATAAATAAVVAAAAVTATAGEPAPQRPRPAAGGVEIDPATRTAVVDGVTVDLSGREFNVLRVLAEHAGEPVSRDALLAGVWRAGWVGSAKTLDVTVGRLRNRLDAAGLPDRVVTVRGTGYRLDAAPAAPAL